MLHPAPKRILRKTGIVLLQIIGAVVVFAVLITVGAYAVHGLILAIAALP